MSITNEAVVFVTSVATALGAFQLAATDRGLCGLLLPKETDRDLPRWLDRIGPHTVQDGSAHPTCQLAAEELQSYLRGELTAFSVPLDLRGTPFQLKVWETLRQIPYGETRSYGQVAASVGNPRGVRAVGMANNRNPVAIIVPCHRVIGANGSLVGYGGGLSLKEHLLSLERSVLAQVSGW